MPTPARAKICNGDDFDKAIAAPTKSAQLLRELTYYVVNAPYWSEDQILTLQAEPNLQPQALADISEAMLWNHSLPTRILVAICVHPSAEADMLAATLWQASEAQAQEVATTTGTLLPIVAVWTRLHSDTASPTAERRAAQVGATHSRWTAWAEGDPCRMSLLTAALTFTTAGENEMFAAVDAMCRPPQQTAPRPAPEPPKFAAVPKP